MSIVETVAKEFHLEPEELVQEGIKAYLMQKLSKIESEIHSISKKYGVNSIFELDEKVKKGCFNEEEAHDDYFLLDNLEYEKKKVLHIIDNLS